MSQRRCSLPIVFYFTFQYVNSIVINCYIVITIVLPGSSLWRHNRKYLVIKNKWAYTTRFVQPRFCKKYATMFSFIKYLDSRWGWDKEKGSETLDVLSTCILISTFCTDDLLHSVMFAASKMSQSCSSMQKTFFNNLFYDIILFNKRKGCFITGWKAILLPSEFGVCPNLGVRYCSSPLIR